MTRRGLFAAVVAAVIAAVLAPKAKRFGPVDSDINPYALVGTAYLDGRMQREVIRANDVEGWIEIYAHHLGSGGLVHYSLAVDPVKGGRVRVVQRVYGDVRIELHREAEFLEYNRASVERKRGGRRAISL